MVRTCVWNGMKDRGGGGGGGGGGLEGVEISQGPDTPSGHPRLPHCADAPECRFSHHCLTAAAAPAYFRERRRYGPCVRIGGYVCVCRVCTYGSVLRTPHIGRRLTRPVSLVMEVTFHPELKKGEYLAKHQ